MAAPGEQLLLVKHRLILSPTSANTPGGDGSYGGTFLGTTQLSRLRLTPRSDDMTEEAYGSEVVDTLYLGWDVELTTVLRNWDSDALAEYFPGSAAAGGSGSHRQVFEIGSVTAGTWATDYSSVMMLAPFDPAHPGVLVYNAVPYYRDEIALDFSAYEDLRVEELRWRCLRDASDRVFRIASMADLQAVFP